MGANILLALGSLVMFGTFLGSSNRLLIGNNQIASQNEYYIAALSYAQSVIDEAKVKKFDELAPEIRIGNEEPVLTASDKLGYETTAEQTPDGDTVTAAGFRSVSVYDDVDDYNRYHRRINSSRAEGYDVYVNVYYTDKLSSGTKSAVTTPYKRMDVKVTSRYFPKQERDGKMVQDTLTVSYIFSY